MMRRESRSGNRTALRVELQKFFGESTRVLARAAFRGKPANATQTTQRGGFKADVARELAPRKRFGHIERVAFLVLQHVVLKRFTINGQCRELFEPPDTVIQMDEGIARSDGGDRLVQWSLFGLLPFSAWEIGGNT